MSFVKGYFFRNQFHQRGLPSLFQPNTITMFACSLVSPSSPLQIKTQKGYFSFKLSFSYFKILIMRLWWYWVLIHSPFCKYELHWTFIVLHRPLSLGQFLCDNFQNQIWVTNLRIYCRQWTSHQFHVGIQRPRILDPPQIHESFTKI